MPLRTAALRLLTLLLASSFFLCGRFLLSGPFLAAAFFLAGAFFLAAAFFLAGAFFLAAAFFLAGAFFLAAAFFLAGAFFLAAAFFLAGAFFLAAAFFLAGAFFLAAAFFLAGAFFLAAAFFLAGALLSSCLFLGRCFLSSCLFLGRCFLLCYYFFLSSGFLLCCFLRSGHKSLLKVPVPIATLSRFIFIDKQTEWHLNLAQHAHYVTRNVIDSTDTIKLMILNGIELTIKINQWTRLLMINIQTLLSLYPHDHLHAASMAHPTHRLHPAARAGCNQRDKYDRTRDVLFVHSSA